VGGAHIETTYKQEYFCYMVVSIRPAMLRLRYRSAQHAGLLDHRSFLTTKAPLVMRGDINIVISHLPHELSCAEVGTSFSFQLLAISFQLNADG